jgi:predicted XRE-type DNA-binding protein
MGSKQSKHRVVASSGNVFADLALPNAEDKHTKVRLAAAINQIIESQHLTQVAAAQLLDINQPKVSALLNYQLQGFSVERLLRFLTALARDVEIVIHAKPRAGKRGRILVSAA